MQCRNCGLPIPEGTLGCQPCLLNSSRAGLLRLQQDFIERIAAGQMELRLARKRSGAPPHLQMLGDATQTYCGEHLDPPVKRTREAYTEQIRGKICPACMAVFDQALVAAVRTQG